MHRVFISCVSKEFGEHRIELAEALDTEVIDVRHQENFTSNGEVILTNLDDFLKTCKRVIHLVGRQAGAKAEDDSDLPSENIRLIQKRYPGLEAWLRKHLGIGIEGHTYTQWEAYLALFHGVRLDVYLLRELESWKKKPPARTKVPQRLHLARLRPGERLVTSFDDKYTLYKSVSRNLIDEFGHQALSAKAERWWFADPNDRPRVLPIASIGNRFKGRAKEMRTLRKALIANHATAVVTPQAIHGLGGVGKTRLAVEYAWRHKEDYAAIFFVTLATQKAAEEEDSKDEGPEDDKLPAELITGLGNLLPIMDPSIDKTAAISAKVAFELALREFESHKGWLLILDNADTPKAVAVVQTLIPRLHRGHVLITSRRAKWKSAVTPMELTKLDESSAVSMLLARTPNRVKLATDRADAAKIAREVDGLAVALELAGGFIETRRSSFREYLERWNAHRAEALDWYDEEATDYPASVAITWETTFAQLNESESRLLNLFAWLAPEPIPLNLLKTEPIANHVDDLDDALPGVYAYSLARPEEEGNAITVHRLVQEVTRQRCEPMYAANDLRLVVCALVAAIEGPVDDVQTWPTFEPLIPHMQTISHNLDLIVESPELTTLLENLGVHYYAKALYYDSELLLRRAVLMELEQKPINSQKLSAFMCNLAALLHATDRFTEAKELFLESLKMDEKALGPKDPIIAIRLNNYARLLQDLGITQEAAKHYRRAIEILEADSAAVDPNLGSALNNYANLLSSLGQYPEADKQNKRAIEVDRKLFGPRHPRIATRMNSLANSLQKRRHYEDAEKLFDEVLSIFLESYGPLHPNVAIARNNLACLYRDMGLNEKSESFYHNAISIAENSLGRDHSDCALFAFNLSLLFENQERYPEAQRIRRRSIEIYCSISLDLGRRHPLLMPMIRDYVALLDLMGWAQTQILTDLIEAGVDPAWLTPPPDGDADE